MSKYYVIKVDEELKPIGNSLQGKVETEIDVMKVCKLRNI